MTSHMNCSSALPNHEEKSFAFLGREGARRGESTRFDFSFDSQTTTVSSPPSPPSPSSHPSLRRLSRMQVDQQQAQDVLSEFHSTRFHIATMKDKFQAQAQSDLTQTFSDSAMAQDPGNPTLVEEEISAQIEFFKKIKFKYLEQEAKETFLKLILAEDPVQIDREDNNRLEEENKESKAILKASKIELDALRNEVGRVAEEVATGHAQLTNEVQETDQLSKEIREMELELARLRTTVPVSERMTITEANELLDNQIMEIQTLADEVESKSAKVDETKRELGRLVKVVDRLGPERAKEELRVKNALASRSNVDGDTKRIESICKWYTSLLSLHKSYLSIESITTSGPNDLRITWDLPTPPPPPPPKNSRNVAPPPTKGTEPVTLLLSFDSTSVAGGGGGGGLLVDGSLIGSTLDISEAVMQALPGNDVQGLVGDVLGRLRAERSF
ncbi:hypothetical protein BDY24DRAFT_379560 [Mrakia frigida]|uniref:uncharacterized protein n=1 Tax=Mrakia frigida TaxID=29902 RepID=UPI003FCC210F